MKRFICALLFLPSFGFSATLEEAIFAAKIQTHMNQGVVSACGIELTGIELAKISPQNIFNGSVMFFSNYAGMVKARISIVDINKISSKNFDFRRDTKILPTSEIWLKANNQKPTQPIGGVAPSEDPGYIIYKTDNTLQIIVAILNGEEIQVGYQPKNINHSKIMFGKVNITDSEQGQLVQCIKELKDSLEKNKNR